MKNIASITLVFVAVLFMLPSCGKTSPKISPIIPQPAKLVFGKQAFVLSGKTTINTNIKNKEILAEWLKGLPIDNAVLNDVAVNGNLVEMILCENDLRFSSPEAYEMIIEPSKLRIEASGMAGLFYGVQNLHQLYCEYGVELPSMTIVDYPRFRDRGILFDVSRRYLGPGFLKKQIDIMARYKLNRMRLYLSGDGGWRIDINGYPELVERTAWRTDENYRTWKESGGKFSKRNEPGTYGGYYSEDDIKEIVEYAAGHFITVVPMIDLPCRVRNVAGEAGIICNEKADAAFITKALADIVELFPSEYIYLGNGQADSDRGAVCAGCRKTGAVDARHEPHSDLLNAAEEFLKLKGRKLMTWEGGVFPGLSGDAAIISWHDTEDGLNAAAEGYQVIMAPSDFASLDYYQSDPTTAPEAMSGFLPLEKVYAFNPVTSDIPEEQARRVAGIQANMWTQFVADNPGLQYMLYPRMLAVAETGWTLPERKSYFDFRKRAVKASGFIRESEGDDSCFDLAREVVIRPGSDEPLKSAAIGAKVYYHSMFDDRYPGSGDATLTDGELGGWWYGDGRWQGFMGKSMNLTIDLGKRTEIRSVSATFIMDLAGKIYLPDQVRISVSFDGEEFEVLDTIENTLPDDIRGYHLVDLGWAGNAEARYVRYEAKPDRRPGGWIFTDEIIIN